MKPYRGTLLAAAVLLMALPLSSCGDADDYSETGSITLTSQSATMIVKSEMIFTVTATFPTPTDTTTTTAVIINGCDTTLEYQAAGAGVNHSWRSISGTSATRTFMLRPRETGILTVIARGKCTGSNEDWKYTKQVDVEVTEQATES